MYRKCWRAYEECGRFRSESGRGDLGEAYDAAKSPAVNLGNAIDSFYARGTPCVILIDEYDDPVAKALSDPAEANRVRSELSKIYGQFKGRTNKIRFLMITGVSKFTKMSVFSALSNLTDISPQPEYAAMLGYTEEELDQYFGEHMAAHAKVMGLSIWLIGLSFDSKTRHLADCAWSRDV